MVDGRRGGEKGKSKRQDNFLSLFFSLTTLALAFFSLQRGIISLDISPIKPEHVLLVFCILLFRPMCVVSWTSENKDSQRRSIIVR
jgi:hypothetical protein